MNTSAGTQATVTIEPVKQKMEFTHEQMVTLIRSEYPGDVPENFIAMMTPAFMCGVRATLQKLGWIIHDTKKEEDVKPA